MSKKRALTNNSGSIGIGCQFLTVPSLSIEIFLLFSLIDLKDIQI